MAETTYEIDVEGCRRVLKDVERIKDECEAFKDLEPTIRMVDGYLYSTPELNATSGDATTLDRQLYAFYEDKLLKTYDAAIKELETCISSMSLAVDAFADGDITMVGDGQASIPGTEQTPGGRAGVPGAVTPPSRLPEQDTAVRYSAPYTAEYRAKKD